MAEVNEETGTRPSPNCGRIDEHEPHEHHTHEPQSWKRTPLLCPGTPTIEGGSR